MSTPAIHVKPLVWVSTSSDIPPRMASGSRCFPERELSHLPLKLGRQAVVRTESSYQGTGEKDGNRFHPSRPSDCTLILAMSSGFLEQMCLPLFFARFVWFFFFWVCALTWLRDNALSFQPLLTCSEVLRYSLPFRHTVPYQMVEWLVIDHLVVKLYVVFLY